MSLLTFCKCQQGLTRYRPWLRGKWFNPSSRNGRRHMATDIAQFEQRLSAVESSLSQIQRKFGLAPSPANWVEQVSGSLADIPEEDYQEFLASCRAVRNGVSR